MLDTTASDDKLLKKLEEARERTRKAARRHTKRVKLLRRVVPLLGLLIFLGVIGQITLERALVGLPLGIGSLSLTSDGFVMDAPNLAGSDASGRTYSVSASRAIQSLTDPGLILLESIEARIELEDGETATFTAPKGEYRMQKDSLVLSGGLDIQTGRGDQALMDRVEINLKTGAAVAPDQISITSEIGDISANAFSVEDGGQTVRFEGAVRMTIRPDRIDMLN